MDTPTDKPKQELIPVRMICLLCGREIKGRPLPEIDGRSAPLYTGEAVSILVNRDGQAQGAGFAHAECAHGEIQHDLTGKPEYGGYNENSTLPPYSDGRTVVPDLPTEFDGDPKL